MISFVLACFITSAIFAYLSLFRSWHILFYAFGNPPVQQNLTNFFFFQNPRWKFSPQFANKNTILIIFDGHFSFKWANPGLFFFGCMDTFAKIKKCAIPGLCFCLFSSFSRYNFNTNWKKCRWCAWDSNPRPQDGRRRWNHGALAATLRSISHSINCFGQIKGKMSALWAGALSPIL